MTEQEVREAIDLGFVNSITTDGVATYFIVNGHGLRYSEPLEAMQMARLGDIIKQYVKLNGAHYCIAEYHSDLRRWL